MQADHKPQDRDSRGRPSRGHRRNRSGHRRREQSSSAQGRGQADLGTKKVLSADEIKNLASGESSNVIQSFINNEGGFLAAFNHPPHCSKPHVTLRHLVKLLYLLVKSEDGPLASRIIAEVVGSSSGMSAFLNNLSMMLAMMPTEKREHVKRENPQYLHYICEIGVFAIATVPQSVMYTFPCSQLKDTVQRLAIQGDPLLSQVQNLVDDYIAAQNPVEEPESKNVPSKDDSANILPPPPQNFIELPVLPSSDELHPNAAEPYLRPNVTTGSYVDWEHYLDVQFRLMREDFVGPLRDGISHFEYADKYTPEVRVYEGVSVCSPVCLYTGVGFQIIFDATRFSRVNWEHSRRLIYGSLLCLSCDNFQSMIFATVANRDPKLLKYGLLTVFFEGGELDKGFQIDPKQKYVMVESTAYFEAYRPILKGLQRAVTDQLIDRLPVFKKYIVDCQLSAPIAVPRYLIFSETTKFRLKDVLDIKNGSPDVEITNPDSWPSCENTCLDASQLNAFRAALTQELSIVQGPPGTGKTFIGLKVVEALATNQHRFKNFPILVLCYTNHALDQFLEGIHQIQSDEGKELNIIRIGGRCKSEQLQNLVLKAKIDKLRAQRSIPSRLHKDSVSLREEMHVLQERIEIAQRCTEIKENKVFGLSVLKEFIRSDHYIQLTQDRPTERGREVDVWLRLWYVLMEEEQQELTSQDMARGQNIPENSTPVRQSDSDDEYIQVDAEANKLEEERILAGEELEPTKTNALLQEDVYEPDNPKSRKEDDSKWKIVQINYDERRRRIRRGHTNKPMDHASVNAVTNVWDLNTGERWSLYLYWANELIRKNKENVARHAKRYNELCQRHALVKQDIDKHVIGEADIIGMTTTGAAKYNHILSTILPKVVIIEEAAEVFEAHVFNSLTPSVQQLILIGDHKQLRPKANCYLLEKKYKLCVSMFERLASNGFPFVTLEVQHRMRPDIASLICPSIYDRLLNHESVEEYESIKGVGQNLFFIDHYSPEKMYHDRDNSHANIHEAEFMVALCNYLLKQGYHSTQITILTMYRGQLLELRKRMKRQDYNGVRVAAVDDFQGEENDIILLSLVRSNSDGRIGFLSVSNRICVSLSRARKGFYVIGNLSMLRDKENTVWPQILANLSQKRYSGKALPLYCQLHPDTKVMASCEKDFSKCPEGGCQKQCKARLDCGHSCQRLCHPVDQEHKMTKCKQVCSKPLACGHNCKHECWKCKAKGQCFPCIVAVSKKITRCGHDVSMPCHQDPFTFNCPVKVTKELPCGHSCKAPCWINVDYILCKEPCKSQLDCGHYCSGECDACHRGRLHIPCQSKCGRTQVCGHSCNFPCTPECPPCTEECNNYCIHSKCKRKCYERCVSCMAPCPWQCEHLKCSRPCGEECNRKPCNEPCKKLLKCGHPCIGLCGEKCPSKCRICDKDEVCKILFGDEEDEDARFIELEDCKHIVEVKACDQWMLQTEAEVKFKCCPWCKTQIRQSLRYGNIIKRTLKDYDSIKKQQLINLDKDLSTKFRNVHDEVVQISSPLLDRLQEKLQQTGELIQLYTEQKRGLSPHRVNTISAQLTYVPFVVKMVDIVNPIMISSADQWEISTSFAVRFKDIQDDIRRLTKFIMQEFLSKQQRDDIQSEIYRLLSMIKFIDFFHKAKSQKTQLSDTDKSTLTTLALRIHESGWKTDKLTEDKQDKILSILSMMSKMYGLNGLTESEKVKIVGAMGLAKGHWFKCPNGHFYCIGDCGGAMEEANCPECGARIGGQNHALISDNQLAPEMDGARYAAWSELANNMANFDQEQLQFH